MKPICVRARLVSKVVDAKAGFLGGDLGRGDLDGSRCTMRDGIQSVSSVIFRTANGVQLAQCRPLSSISCGTSFSLDSNPARHSLLHDGGLEATAPDPSSRHRRTRVNCHLLSATSSLPPPLLSPCQDSTALLHYVLLLSSLPLP